MKERVKTILLLLLSGVTAFLIWQTWAYEPAILEALPGGWGTPSPPPDDDGEALYTELSEAVWPAQIAQWRDGARTGALWDSAAVSRAMPLLGRSLGEALGSAGTPEPSTAEAWRAALEGDSVYLRYTDAVPLAALGAWSSYQVRLDVQARRLTLSPGEGGRLRLFYEDAGGGFYACDTAAPALLPDLELETPCFFAFERGGAFSRPEPLQLLPGVLPVFAPLDAGRPADIQSAASPLLKALGIEPDTPFKHDEEPDGVRYVDFRRQCLVTAEGHIHYSDPAPQERAPPPRTQPPLLGYIEEARALCAALSGALGDAEWELRGVERRGGGTVLRFGVHAGGCPVLGPGSAYALLTYTDGGLSEAHFYLRAYARRDSLTELTPLEQSLAAIPPGEQGFTLTAAYLDGGESLLTAHWAR